MQHEDAILDRLAREILMVDSRGQSLIPQYLQILEHGLSKPLPPDAAHKDVIVVGAGIAGLVAGKLLKGAGYNVTIVEANDNRIGGRVKTFHTTPDRGAPFQDPKQYGEAGAMRIPNEHKLVNKLIEIMGLSSKAQLFYNVDVAKDDPSKKTFRTWLKTNGIQARRYAYNKSPLDQHTMGFPVPKEYQDQTADALLSKALEKPNRLINPSQPMKDQIEGWKQVIKEFDEFSMLRYLRQFYPESVIQYVGTLQNLTSRLFLSFMHSFIDTFYISPNVKYYELAGGNWQLPYAFLPHLQENLVMDSRAIELQWSDPAHKLSAPKAVHHGKPGVYVRTINEPMTKRGVVRTHRPRIEREFTGDYLVITIPFSALRFMQIAPLLSYEKRRAIIELHYDSATKVLLEFSERFWEWDEEQWRKFLPDEYRGHNSIGGGSITDSPNRFIYYPSHPVDGSRGGVILASYTWADDASRWDSIPDEDRYNFALKGLTDIYGKGIKRFFTGYGKTESWMEDYYSFGEAAVFSPGQLTALHPYIPGPEGLVHFAGEHTSLKHAWIEGAIESGIRVALEIHEKHQGARA